MSEHNMPKGWLGREIASANDAKRTYADGLREARRLALLEVAEWCAKEAKRSNEKAASAYHNKRFVLADQYSGEVTGFRETAIHCRALAKELESEDAS